MKITFVITSLGMGGAERLLCDISDEFCKLGIEVLIICLTGTVINRPLNKNIQIVNLNMKKNIVGGVKTYWRLRNIIKHFKPDVVHSHMVHANIFTRILRLTMTIPVVISTAHSNNEGGRLRMLAYRLTDFLADMSTNVSQEAVDEFIKKGAVSSGKIVAIYNGIDSDRFVFNQYWREAKRNILGIEPTTPLLLTVGRLTEAKDYPNLLNAFAELDFVVPPELAIIGAGELEYELKDLAILLGINDRIHWLGIRQDVEQWYSASDLFILSSKFEGFGLVVAEAMSCGRPLVVTDAGGVPEVVGDSRLVVPVSDSKALAEKMNEVLNFSDQEKVNIITTNRNRVIESFSIKKISKQWVELYRALMI